MEIKRKKQYSGILIGIAGGSGSGKTLVAETLFKDLGNESIAMIQQDSYYRDLSHLSPKEREKVNFDHPDAVDSDLMTEQISDLLCGGTIEQPVYDFKQHIRSKRTKHIESCRIIILEGILILYYPKLRELMNIKVFVDTDPDIRFIRRLRRDTMERARTMDSVIRQYEETVRPMHLEFVEPSKRYADIIIPEGGYNLVAIDLLKTKVELLLKEKPRGVP